MFAPLAKAIFAFKITPLAMTAAKVLHCRRGFDRGNNMTCTKRPAPNIRPKSRQTDANADQGQDEGRSKNRNHQGMGHHGIKPVTVRIGCPLDQHKNRRE